MNEISHSKSLKNIEHGIMLGYNFSQLEKGIVTSVVINILV